ncbi:MAG TPA: hypothetical protein VKA57_02015 [Solirubrobacteraceae bacterium]|nr:hypothetical protein [Solirubrobacteraceae bacterium]
MAPSPFRRRKAAKTMRNLALAEAALALAKDRVGHGGRRPNRKLLLIGGAIAAAGTAALLKRDKVAGLLPSRSGEPAPPQPSNYDAPGPVANTATPVPAPDPHGVPPAKIDEAAEESAAAAEAGAIGGTSSEYAGREPGERAGEAQRPLAEAGEGEAEGREQAEAALADNATYRDAGKTEAERQIEDTIEQADQPQAGETPEPLASEEAGRASAATGAQQPGADEMLVPPEIQATDETSADTPGGGISGRPFAGLDQDQSETERQGKPEDKREDDSDADDGRTWSGRSVNP